MNYRLISLILIFLFIFTSVSALDKMNKFAKVENVNDDYLFNGTHTKYLVVWDTSKKMSFSSLSLKSGEIISSNEKYGVVSVSNEKELLKLPIKLYEPLKRYYILLDESVPQIKANLVHNLGYNGSGVKVCIIDTGIDFFHENLKQPVASADFTGGSWCLEYYDNYYESETGVSRTFKHYLNVSNASLDWLEIGVVSNYNGYDGHRYDLRVYYPNGTLANETYGTNLIEDNGSYWSILNVTINGTTGRYILELNETNMTYKDDWPLIFWGSNVTNIITYFNESERCVGKGAYSPIGKDPRAFLNFGADDDMFHGTHVAGIIVSNNTTYRGVAPGVDIYIAKVFDMYGYADDINILNAIDWCINQKVNIISMSLGGKAGFNCNSTFDLAISNLTSSGILPVIAVGNSGPSGIDDCRVYNNDGSSYSICSPGCVRNALSVGSVGSNDEISGFSSRGPVQALLEYTKPDVVAPGRLIFSTMPTNLWAYLSGTSMSTPHASGLAALILQKYPNWTPQMVKAAIIGSANQSKVGFSSHNNTYGWGRIDALKSVENITINSYNITNNSAINFSLCAKDEFLITTYWEEGQNEAHNKINLTISNNTYSFSVSNGNDTTLQAGLSSVEGCYNISIEGVNVYNSKKIFVATNDIENVTIHSIILKDDDYFVTKGDEITLLVNATDNYAVAWVKANISEVNSSSDLVNLSYNSSSNLYEATILINQTPQFKKVNITILTQDNVGNGVKLWNNSLPFVTIVLYNISSPLSSDACINFTSNNLSEIKNFSSFNLTLNYYYNGSCQNYNWSNFKKVGIINFSNVNISFSGFEKLLSLNDYLKIYIMRPNSFDIENISLENFTDLNVNSSIQLFDLPFSEKAYVYHNKGSNNQSINSTWSIGDYFSDYDFALSNVSFVINQWYDLGNRGTIYIYDNKNESVQIITGSNYSSPFVFNFTANGTGTRINKINLNFSGSSYEYIRNSSGVYGNLICNNTTLLGDIVNCSVNLSASSGNYNITIWVEDYGYYQNNLLNFSIIVDNEGPNVTYYDLNNTYYNHTDILREFNVSDIHEVNQCWLYINNNLVNSTSAIKGNNTLFYNHTISEGNFTEYITCSDNFGNNGSSDNMTFYIDLILPKLEFITPNMSNFSKIVNLTIYVNESLNLSKVLCFDNNNLINQTDYISSYDGQINYSLNLSEGLHIIKVKVIDRAGNINESELIINVDLTPPKFYNYSIENLTENSVIIKSFWNDTLSNCSFNYLDKEIDANISGNEAIVNLTNLNSSAKYNFNFNCKDKVGNENNSSFSYFTTLNIKVEEINANENKTLIFNYTDFSTNYTLLVLDLFVEDNVTAQFNVSLSSVGYNSLNRSIPKVIDINSNVSNLSWAVIKLYYNDSEVPSYLDESSLRLYYFNSTSSKWELVPGGVDTTNNYVWGNTTHFSIYSIGGKFANGQTCSSNSECSSNICCNGVCASSCQSGSKDTSNSNVNSNGGGLVPTSNSYYEILEESLIKTLKVGDELIFNFEGVNYTIKVISIGKNYTTLKINGSEVNLFLNETKTFDLDKKGSFDLNITLRNLSSGSIELFLVKLKEENKRSENITIEEKPLIEEKVPIEEKVEKIEENNISKVYFLIIGSVIIFILVLILYLRRSKFHTS